MATQAMPTASAAPHRMQGLLARNADGLAASCAHPLLRAMHTGAIAPETFERYLALEGAFVLTAVRAVAACLATERDESVMARMSDAIHTLLGEQRAFLARPSVRTGSDAEATELHVLVETAVERADIPRLLVLLAGAETLYERWCGNAFESDHRRPVRVQRWIEMHTSESFRAGAALWRELVDRLPSETEDDDLDDAFKALLRAEDAFHSTPLEGAWM